jgi:peroxiredoxin
MILRRITTALLTCALLVGFAPLTVQAQEASVNQQAPDFTLTAADGETHSLSDFEGKYVVLEWLNYGCPFVQKHYESGNMQKLQESYTEKDVVWLSIVSSAEGKQGHYPPQEMMEQKEKHNGEMTAILMDTSGEVGKMYGAQVTPHMYVINPEGQLIYKGGIDDKPTTDTADIEGATNYVKMALDQATSGEEVAVQTARPYGCSVKYATK